MVAQVLLSSLLLLLPITIQALDPDLHDLKSASSRKYFYAGGQYTINADGQHIFKDSIYVEHLKPANGITKKYPLVFVHGQALTGANFLNKPDGSPGWTSYFLTQGYEIYLVDQTYRGRSPWNPEDGSMTTYSAEYIESRQTATRRYNLWPQSLFHTQWLGNGSIGDSIFDAYYASSVQFLTSGAVQQQSSFQFAGAALLDRIGKPVILLGHSQGGIQTWLLGDACPNLVRLIVGLESSGPPFENAVFTTEPARPYGLTDAPVKYELPVKDPVQDLVKDTTISMDPDDANCTLQAEPIRRLANLANIPAVVLTSESSFHAQYDWCTVKYLQQAGVDATHIPLGEVGTYGNGHMMFLEENSETIAGLLSDILERFI